MLRPTARRCLDDRARPKRIAAALPGLAAALSLAAAVSAEPPKIYKWVDSNGIAHYTTDPTRIPGALRDRFESIDRSRPEPAEAATAPAPTPPPSEAAAAMPPVPAPDETPPGSDAPATETTAAAPETTRPTVAPPTASTIRSGNAWFERDALPRAPDSSILASGQATPAQLDALAAEQEALDARIAELQGEIARDERFLKGLISDPDLDADVPLFDRPEFLEVSQRLPDLQARLQELRDERAKLETP